MPSKWQEKKDRLAKIEFERNLLNAPDDTARDVSVLASAAAMGGGEEAIFEKKLSKEEKKARAKAAREAKAKNKGKKGTSSDDGNDDIDDDGDDDDDGEKISAMLQATVGEGGIDANMAALSVEDDGIDHEKSDALAAAGTICTFSASRKGVDARSRDINVQNFSLQHMGQVLLDATEIVLNHGNRYGLVGVNGCGKSTLLKAIGARAIPVPRSIDIFFLSEEVEPSDTVTALDAVMSVDEERLRLEQHAEDLNHLLTLLADADANGTNISDSDQDGKTLEEQQEEVMDTLNAVYERLDALDASTAEVRARSILKGLGFTHEMQGKLTKDFSGGWRMRVSLARALFIQPVCLLLDEPTNREFQSFHSIVFFAVHFFVVPFFVHFFLSYDDLTCFVQCIFSLVQISVSSLFVFWHMAP
jgi:ATP-binding cassette, subfamily F, member 2